VIQLTGIKNMQFNVILDEGFGKGFRVRGWFRDVQFNDVLVV
jgi:hypothetical protein